MWRSDNTTNTKPIDFFVSEVHTTLIAHDVSTAHLTPWYE